MCNRVYPEMIPSNMVKVCPMDPSLDQKEKDDTLTKDEEFMLYVLNIHRIISSWESESPTRI